jgi:hypothetical protein
MTHLHTLESEAIDGVREVAAELSEGEQPFVESVSIAKVDTLDGPLEQRARGRYAIKHATPAARVIVDAESFILIEETSNDTVGAGMLRAGEPPGP